MAHRIVPQPTVSRHTEKVFLVEGRRPQPHPPELLAERRPCPHEDDSLFGRLQTQLLRIYFGALHQYIWVLPLFAALYIPLLCLSIYLASLYYGHVAAIFPYISDAGTNHPEAAFFSQILDNIAFLALISAYARYRQLQYIIDHLLGSGGHSQWLPRRLAFCNTLAWIVFQAVFYGIIMVGNFRANELIFCHLAGAGLAFGSIIVYGTLMIYLCFKLWREYGIESAPISMLLIGVIVILSNVVGGICMVQSLDAVGFTRMNNVTFRLHWSAEHPGYRAHITSAAMEWIQINSFAAFLMSISRRMRLFTHWSRVFKA